MSEQEWTALEAEVQRDVETALVAARTRPNPDPATIKKYVYEEADTTGTQALGGLTREERRKLGGTEQIAPEGEMVRFAEAVRQTLAHELEVNPKMLVFGEDVGRKGGVHLVSEGLQKRFGEARVFDTSLSEEGIIGRSVGMAISGLMPVAEIQFRKYADPATEQLNNCGTLRWRTANRFAAPMVVRMPGGFGKDVGDPWHSVSGEVTWVHAVGWQVCIPSNAADAVGLLRAAMRSANPTIFFEHRSLLMTSDGSARYPGDDYVLPLGKANVLCQGTDLSLITWGALTHRCAEAVRHFGDRVELIDLRTVAPWDKACVLASVKKTGRCLIVHEDMITAGFGAEIAATVASDCFWSLDAPVERFAVEDIPIPYHPALLTVVVPDAGTIAQRIERLLGV